MLHRHRCLGSHLGDQITSEHYKQPMTIGEWNLHAKALPKHTSSTDSGLC